MPSLPGGFRAPRVRAKRPSASARGYDRRWQRFARLFLSDHPVCTCGQLATQVDHKTPLAEGGEKYDPDNLQALCASCHSRKTAEHDGGFGR